jgi:two-component system chemotaxis sensor kinase CheA
VGPGEIHGIAGKVHTLRMRDEYLPVLRLADLFPARQAASGGGEIAVIVESDGARAALMVDQLVGQQQVVVKSLDANFRRVPGISGATIMGDGKVALILDTAHIIGHAQSIPAGARNEPVSQRIRTPAQAQIAQLCGKSTVHDIPEGARGQTAS